MTQRPGAHRAVALLLTAGMALAACGGGATPTPAATNGPTPMPTPGETAAAGATVAVANSAVGRIAVDGEGRSLYLFTQDAQGGGRSTCNDACAEGWPPLVVDASTLPTAGEGVTGPLGTSTRDDGSTQVTLGGWPLYYFAGDTVTGDTNGQAVSGVWWLVSPDGSPIDAAPPERDEY
jgi:predicted lipoprotein with Yx(FWY)xxD motif